MKTTVTSLLLLAFCSVPVTGHSVSTAGPGEQDHAQTTAPRPSSPVTEADSTDDSADSDRRADSADDRPREEGEEDRRADASIDRVQFSGQIFTNYGVNTTGTGAEKNFNSFALDRWYFTARADLSDEMSFRGTTDIVSPAASGGGYMVVVKYAYFNWQIQSDLELRAGVHQTGWENYVNSVWGYRGTSKTMAHYQGHISTSDLGATLSYTLPSQFGTASIGVHNGQGYRSLESDQFKDMSGQVRLTPFAQSGGILSPLQVSGHVYRGTHNDGRSRLRWGGLMAYRADGYTLAVNYETREDGNLRGSGFSTFGTLRVGTLGPVGDVSLLGMLNFYDPSKAGGDDRSVRSVMGVAVEPASGLTVTLDYQQVQMESPVLTRYDGDQTDVDGNLFLHVILNY